MQYKQAEKTAKSIACRKSRTYVNFIKALRLDVGVIFSMDKIFVSRLLGQRPDHLRCDVQVLRKQSYRLQFSKIH